ncbi:unnamed protein product [Callosobruchus maculatus]|uniref:Zinc carboxypeptidase A 1 n=1 Tax=Callosobruchus maculatus TaxID=64391 RepID=A0A653CB64_CALMS|nr:unnamed protein product [Callosobruchus maculatus]
MESTKVLLLLLAIQNIVLAYQVRYDNHAVYRVTPKTRQHVEVLKYLEKEGWIDFWTPLRSNAYPVDIMVAPGVKRNLEIMLEDYGIDTTNLISNVQEVIDEQKGLTKSRSLDWNNYYTLTEIQNWVYKLSENYVNIVTVDNVKSYEKRNVTIVKVSFNSSATEAVFIESNIHAREWISSAVSTYILSEILNSTEPRIVELRNKYNWYFVPVVNPDGFAYSHEHDRLWRKTRKPYGGCFGADPNRNWDNHWNEFGADDNPCSEIYSGPKPFSEQCAKNLAEYLTNIPEKIRTYISFHSFSQLILIPYGYTTEHLENYDQVYNISFNAAEVLKSRYGTSYTVGTITDVIYPASGGSIDWAKATLHIPISVAYELRDTGKYGFLLPPDQIIPTAEETIDSVLYMVEESQYL